MSGWLNGIVKSVSSGDCLIIMGKVASGPPPEKQITLSSLISPRLGRQDSPDEPYAWESREFLRKKVIGKDVVFRIDYTVPTIAREFGTVYLKTTEGQPPENVSLSVVGAGLCKVRESSGNQAASPDYDELIRLQEDAQQKGLGLWSKEPRAGAIRAIPTNQIDAMALLETSKGKALPGVVEAVLNGSTVKMTMLPNFHTVTVVVGGIQCPSMGRRPAPVEGQEALAAPVPDPFAREAKHFTECKVLNREVRVVLQGVDKFNNLFGTLYHPESEQPVDLAEQLCRLGLAKVVDWSAQMLGKGAEKLRLAERAAKDVRLRIWHDYVPPPKNSSPIMADSYVGKVAEIFSGDTIIVRDNASGVERRVALSSIRAPRLGNPRRNIKGEPYAIEAKEFLRSRLIAKTVSVNMEYSRTITAQEGGPDLPDRTMNFGSVHLLDKKNPGEPGANVAEMVVVRGLASVVKHRGEDDRSMHYDALQEAESRAQKQKKGIHSSKEPPAQHVNDISFGPANKAKQLLPFLQRSGTMTAVVEMVLSGHRLKLYVPKESTLIVFALAGVRAPSKGRDGAADEPYAAQALAYTRMQCMQQEVEFDVEAVDQTGTFLGNVRTVNKKLNLATGLLEAGLGSLHPMFNLDRAANGAELAAAEATAKQARLKIWENYVEPPVSAAGEAEKAAESDDANVEAFEATAIEVESGSCIYVHRADKKQSLDWLVGQLESLDLKEQPATGGIYSPSVGSLCCARFTQDNQWYRARICSISPDRSQATVFYIDFGNSETLSATRLTTLDPSITLQALPPLAVKCQLAYLKVPTLDEDLGVEAATMLSRMVFGCTLAVRVEGHEGSQSKWGAGDSLLVTLIAADATASVNARLVEAGLARLQKVRGKRAVAAAEGLKEFQERARMQRLNMWQYGDVDSDDEDGPPAKAWGRK